MTAERLTCQWCRRKFTRPNSRGPAPKFCSNAHRQAAHQAKAASEYTKVRVPRELRRRVGAMAMRRGITVDKAVEQALLGWLNPSRYCDI